mmetsp:Transcript_36462/g.118587  ORF Transcript_36462/g.118587 Transcript_36462/m.118587 type:complete len:291 (-) Transcript_36462:51-923(-)
MPAWWSRFSSGNILAEAVQSASPAGAGSASGNSLVDGSGAPPAAAGLRAVATLVTGLSAGSFLMAPVSSTEASAPHSAAGMSFLRAPSTAPVGAVGGPVGRGNLDQKTAVGRGAWAANMALALSESTAPASGAFAAAGSFLRTSSVPDFATEMLTFLTPHALAPRSEGDTDSEMTIVMRPSSAGTIPTFAKDFIGEDSPATLPPPASMPSLSGPGSPSVPVPVLAVPVSMPCLSETGSEGMPTALPPDSMTVVLSARDACLSASGGGGESLSTSLSPAAGTNSSLSMLIE